MQNYFLALLRSRPLRNSDAIILCHPVRSQDFEHFYDLGFINNELADRPENNLGLASTKGKQWKRFKTAVTPAFRLKYMKGISIQLNR